MTSKEMVAGKAGVDTLGDRLKAIEQIEASRAAQRDLPLIARLDGRAFHTFTKGLARPYDVRLSQLMIDTTSYLVEQTHAKLGYTQSDEISLVWWNATPESAYMFDGKLQKLTSVLAGMASGFFTKYLNERIPEKNEIAVFDCRVWNVANKHEAYLNYLWRQDDCVKNSISMAAQAHFSHKQLNGIDSEGKKKMLRDINQPWEEQPKFFRFGTFIRREPGIVHLTQEQLEKIPLRHRPTGPVIRTKTVDMNAGYIKDEPRVREIFA